MAQTGQSGNDNDTTTATQKLSQPSATAADPTAPSLTERVGELVPEWAVPALAAAKKYLVDPLNRMNAAAQKTGGEAAKDTVAALGSHPLVTGAAVARQALGLPPTDEEAKEVGEGVDLFQQRHPAITGAAEGVGAMAGGFLGDPRNWPFLATGAAEKLLSGGLGKLMSAGISAQQAYSVAKTTPAVASALNHHDYETAAKLITEELGSAFVGAQAARHAAGGIDFTDLGGKVVGKITEAGQKMTAPIANRPAFREMNPEAGKMDFSPLGGKEIGRIPEDAPAEAAPVTTNASGESSASQEAQSREQSMKSRGEHYVAVDSRTGSEAPLIGVDAHDRAHNPHPFETTYKVNAAGERERVMEGGRVRLAPAVSASAPKRVESESLENPNTFEMGDLTEPKPEEAKAPEVAAPAEAAPAPEAAPPQKIKIVTTNGLRTTVPPEKTTGSPAYDAAIKQGGGIPGGKFGPLMMFHDPDNGSTLALPEHEVSPEAVQQQIVRNRALFDKARHEAIANSANDFNQKRGVPERIDHAPVAVNPVQAADVADAYDELVHNPNDPAVKKSYDAMISEVEQQWSHAKSDLKMEFEPVAENPYPNAQAMLNDIYRNRHLAIWTGGAPPTDHPLSTVNPRTGISNNVMFRGVHNVFGHAAGGHDFSQSGEESAYHAHQQMFSPEARPAMTTETKGQASWFYNNRGARQGWADRAVQTSSAQSGGAINPHTGEADGKGFGIELMPERREILDHPATAKDFENFYEKNKDLLDQHPELRIGWNHNGRELNLGAATKNRAVAERVGQKLDQRAIWDIAEKKETPTGGTGEKTKFNYPLKQRLQDLSAADKASAAGTKSLAGRK